MNTIVDLAKLAGIRERYQAMQQETAPVQKPESTGFKKPEQHKEWTIESVFSWWDHRFKITWERVVENLACLSEKEINRLPYDERANFRREILTGIEETLRGEETGTMSRRWHLQGIEDKLRLDDDTGYPLPNFLYQRAMKLNGKGDRETIVMLITPDEADQIRQAWTEYMTAKKAAEKEGKRFERQNLPQVYEFLPKHNEATTGDAGKYVRDNRMFVKVCLDRQLESEFYQIAKYLNKLFNDKRFDVKGEHMAYGRYLGYYGVRKDGARTTMRGMSQGVPGANTFYINPKFRELEVKGMRLQGQYVLRCLTAEDYQALYKQEVPEGMMVAQLAIHQSSPMHARLSKWYRDGAMHPQTEAFGSGAVIEVNGYFQPSDSDPFMGITNAMTGKVDDVMYAILARGLQDEDYRASKQSGNDHGSDTAEAPPINWEARPADNKSGRDRERREQRQRADHVRGKGGNKQRGGARNITRDYVG